MSDTERIFGIIFVSLLTVWVSRWSYLTWFRPDTVIERYRKMSETFRRSALSEKAYLQMGRLFGPVFVAACIIVLISAIRALLR